MSLAEAIRETDMPEDGRHVMNVLDKSGDNRIMWDPGRPDEVEVAKKAFETAKKKGYVAYRVDATSGDKGAVMKDFDPAAEKVIMAPAMQGG